MPNATARYFHSRRGLLVVETGFSWAAFAFSGLWAIVNSMWWPAELLLLLLDAALWCLAGYAAAQGLSDLAWLSFSATLAYAVVRRRTGSAG